MTGGLVRFSHKQLLNLRFGRQHAVGNIRRSHQKGIRHAFF